MVVGGVRTDVQKKKKRLWCFQHNTGYSFGQTFSKVKMLRLWQSLKLTVQQVGHDIIHNALNM